MAHKILIVDDEPDLTKMISLVFSSKGFETLTASDGVDAIEKLENYSPDLIILDVNMPRMGGIEFFSKICDENNKPTYPVLVLTARANIKDLFTQLNIDGFMVKPFEIEELVAEAELIIKKHSRDYKKTSYGTTKTTRKICIAENDQASFDAIISSFVMAGYIVNPARSGADAIERMRADVPDIALVKLSLDDIPGDMVVFKLSQMAKTMDVKYILYSKRNPAHEKEKEVIQGLKEKTGVFDLIEYSDPKELLEAMDRLLNK